MQSRRGMAVGVEMAAFAHDLRTPMCIAAGAAQMALEAGGRDVSVQLQQILQAMGAMDRMLSMMSSPSEGTNNRAFTADMLRKELLAMTTDQAKRKGQRLSIDMSALSAYSLELDYAALCRLLLNLLGNAVKYTQAGGTITLRAQLTHSRWRQGDLSVCFIVADNGPGMTQRFMRRMYLPYARSPETADQPGHGLGLSIARNMVKQLGGTIRVRSKRGMGTIFTVNVPARGVKHA